MQAACLAGGLAHALPVDVGHLHAQERGAAVSSLRARTRGWIDTEQGQTWLTERAAQADDDEPAGPEGVTPVDVEPPAPPPRAKRKRGQASAGHCE